MNGVNYIDIQYKIWKYAMYPVIVLFSDPEHELPLDGTVQVKVLSSHLTPIVPGLKLREHEHSHWEISFIIEGEMFSFCDDVTVHCTEESDNIFVMPPGVLHSREFGREKMNCNLTLTFLLDKDISDDVFELCRKRKFSFVPKGFLGTLLKQLKLECREHKDNGVLPALIQTFLLCFVRDFFNIMPNRKEEKENHLWKYADKSSKAEDIFYFLGDGIGRPDLMRHLEENFHLSLRQLNRIFSEKYGISLKEAQDNLRLNEACQLLVSTTLDNADISRMLGFANPAGFYTFFRRKMSMTPGEYRSRHLTLP